MRSLVMWEKFILSEELEEAQQDVWVSLLGVLPL